jgi:two-component system, NtrC family, sensor kinase
MTGKPTLRQELIGAFAIVFAGALFVATLGVLFVVPRLGPGYAALYVATLLLADVAVFSWFGAVLLRRRLFHPLNGLVHSVEAIADGDLARRLPDAEAEELARLSAAVNRMAETLITDRRKLTENIRSLDETNRLLTEARDAMIRAEKLASVGRLGAGIAHEVGNPLSAVMAYLGLVGRQVDGTVLEMVRAAEREAQRIDRIVRGLLDFARTHETVSQPTDVNDVVRSTLELVRTQGHFNSLDLDSDLGDGQPLIINGDPHQLQQVLVNLLVNAADAVEDVSEPRITVLTRKRRVLGAQPHTPARRKSDPPGIDYSHRRRLARMPRWPVGDPESETDHVVEIIVVDNGPGLPPELIDNVFEPFVTTKEPGKGTGLGLALCARLIEDMGGLIHAGNTDDGGAAFRVILPESNAEVLST